MKTEKININKIKLNPNNPRLIKDDKFAKLVQSIKDFPEMLEIRPIVVNDDMIILGGNMRFKACKEAGLKEVSIIKVSGLSAEKQREFLIKDNVSGGEWDWEMLKDWDSLDLQDWGLDIKNFNTSNIDYNPNINPFKSQSEISEDDFKNKKNELEVQMSSLGKTELLEILCPHCGENFKIRKDEKGIN
jgi:hypothetical protein